MDFNDSLIEGPQLLSQSKENEEDDDDGFLEIAEELDLNENAEKMEREKYETTPKSENNVSTKRKSKLTLNRDRRQSTTPAPPLTLPRCKYFLLLTL